MRRIVTLLAVAIAFAIGCSDQYAHLPMPSRVDREPITNTVVNLGLGEKYIIQGLDSFNGNEVETLAQLLEFLRTKFGQPPVRNITLEFRLITGSSGHALTTVAKNKRTVAIDRINFYPTQNHFIVHELFHALYQTSEWMRNSTTPEVERWATYAQILYKYRNYRSNAGIREVVIRELGVTEEDIDSYRRRLTNWGGVPNDELLSLYFVNVLPLLDNEHDENLITFRLIN